MTLLSSGRVGEAVGLTDDPSSNAIQPLADLITYPGDDTAVVDRLTGLALDTPMPFLLRPGSYLVSTEVPPGTYRATDVEDCYWATLDAAGEINDNNFVSSAPQVLMTVNASDFAVENDCGVMMKVA